MFETAAGNVAEFISRGFNGTEIGDKLEDLAVQVGARLDDVDARQGIIAAAILKAANGHKPLLTSRAKFLADFVAPDYLVDGIIQRRSLYALTGPTGGGKTALALELTSAVARICDRATFGGHNVEGGRVVYFVGENPDDVRARIVGADYYRNDGPSTDRVHFIVGVFKIEEIRERVAQEGRNAWRSSPGDY